MRMLPALQSFAILAVLTTATGVTATGCGMSKRAQCEAVIAEAQKNQNAFEKVDTDKPAELKKALALVESSNKSLEAVKLEDEKLKDMRVRYVKAHANIATVMQKMADIDEKMEKMDVKDVDKLKKEVEALEKQSETSVKDGDKVIDEINSYCDAK
jgi:predicted  nucleic acid-binding Zn-ribbon protein